METQLPPNLHLDYTVLRENESLDGIKVVDHHLLWQINHIAKQRTWSEVRKLYHWICMRVADFLEDRRSKIKSSLINGRYKLNNKPTQQDMEKIQSCTSVDDIMEIIGISEQWIDVSYLDNFLHYMTDPFSRDMHIAELWLDRYKQLL